MQQGFRERSCRAHRLRDSITLGQAAKESAAMLIISRKKNESLVINNDITLTVVEIRGDKIRLGIVAPKEMPVHRQEVWEAIHGRPEYPPVPEPVFVPPPAAPQPSRGTAISID